jgi:CheY-like chemotaxis protein
MDLNIPGTDCMQCVNEIKKLNLSTKIIAQTAHVMSGEGERCLDAGCDAYITKPFSKEDLFTEVRKILA